MTHGGGWERLLLCIGLVIAVVACIKKQQTNKQTNIRVCASVCPCAPNFLLASHNTLIAAPCDQIQPGLSLRRRGPFAAITLCHRRWIVISPLKRSLMI